MKTNKLISPFDWFLFIGILVTSVAYSVLSGEIDVLGTVAAVLNIICVVLSAKGSRWNFIFGVVFCLIYAWICFSTKHYGNAVVYGLLFLPMNIIGYFQWVKQGNVEGSEQVCAKRLTPSQMVIWSVFSFALIVASVFVLKKVGGSESLTDGVLTVICVVAQLLMTFAYMEQWWVWILINVVTVIMWTQSALNGTEHAAIMAINYLFTLINSVNGLIVWRRLSARK
ncbi:MAG: nicotinamide riboside transporter PnuC [Bacteroidales bacterium]|nr:nicotinamide riboside transporter PnuC [Bacteroidales bacterium]